ncbi:hypothetical protein B0H14DRAFT_2631884 [Mycena olivaceomarginata]|nr:hypothetical protein B0H14DRAFT_2631884 [Mycena olivaceomarginata]
MTSLLRLSLFLRLFLSALAVPFALYAAQDYRQGVSKCEMDKPRGVAYLIVCTKFIFAHWAYTRKMRPLRLCRTPSGLTEFERQVQEAPVYETRSNGNMITIGRMQLEFHEVLKLVELAVELGVPDWLSCRPSPATTYGSKMIATPPSARESVGCGPQNAPEIKKIGQGWTPRLADKSFQDVPLGENPKQNARSNTVWDFGMHAMEIRLVTGLRT